MNHMRTDCKLVVENHQATRGEEARAVCGRGQERLVGAALLHVLLVNFTPGYLWTLTMLPSSGAGGNAPAN